MGGLLFLLQYAATWFYFFTDYEWYKESALVWTLVVNGLWQSATVILEVGPTLVEKDQGEFNGNMGTLSREFVTENGFY